MDAGRRRAHPDNEAQAQADLGQVLGGDRGALRLTAGSAQETLELALEGFRRFNAGDFAGFWELQHPDVVMATDRTWPGGGTFRGRAEFQRFLGQFLEAFSTIRFEFTREPEIVADAPIFRGHWTGSGAASEIEASSVDFSVVFRGRDGLIDEAYFFFDEHEAREHAKSQT